MGGPAHECTESANGARGKQVPLAQSKAKSTLNAGQNESRRKGVAAQFEEVGAGGDLLEPEDFRPDGGHFRLDAATWRGGAIRTGRGLRKELQWRGRAIHQRHVILPPRAGRRSGCTPSHG